MRSLQELRGGIGSMNSSEKRRTGPPAGEHVALLPPLFLTPFEDVPSTGSAG
jgi:hypothetical protein